ncbi:hypothetical protein TWF225_004104 [Orbilia oligospora]|uniref:Charged multivesicular body protein 5 n=1 Tax=Orbilia oligospora TaxID=2813651 RepID=A0A7C8JSM5_ORBOL|nr:hypothetical protein TWF706_001223 [Orbilia oligospora]KAF3086085.1 hypothetical protein TWF103_001856 [Orbilia oligospora]KAF3094120.1 hypothetical protein TWF102_007628 [Orbilia oligospora]KAF3129458.1 hypothetical protein TWF703_008923 [Orbilia oligospora]KAF3138665.1 hypothetical protein TWF594_006858 [Orbilia oligospora]
MNRLFGTKSTGPKPTLDDAISKIDTRVSSLDVQISKLNAELATYQSKMSKMRDGPAKNSVKTKALSVLKRRKQYETQRDQLMNQSWNMEQANMMTDNLKNVMTTVDALKTTNQTLKKQYGKIDIDKIEQLQDEMADLLEIGNDINASLARAYDVPDDIDESELDAELEALGAEAELGWSEANMESEIPSFLQEEVPTFIDGGKDEVKPVKEAAT